MAKPTIAPYGSWKSPITGDLLVAETIGLGRIALDGPDTYWAELRPSEEGRDIIVKRTAEGEVFDVTPDQFSMGTRVHEYGASGYSVSKGVVYFSNFEDHRLYRHRPGEQPLPLTPKGDLRYGGMDVDSKRSRIICVREDHTGDDAEAVNSLVAIDADGSGNVQILMEGDDFYAIPTLSPSGDCLAWLSWNHPTMPWDGTELWLASVKEDGTLEEPELIAGGPVESVAQPEWSPDGVLYFVSDRSGWWNLHRWRNGQVEPVLEMEAEFAKSYWWGGMDAYGFESATSIICSYAQQGVWHLGRLNVEDGGLEKLSIPYSEMGSADLKVAPGRVVFEAGSPLRPMSLLELDLNSGKLSVLQTSTPIVIDPGYLSLPEPIEFPTESEENAHAFYYAPQNKDFQAPEAERPPLLVTCHGGPTGAASMDLDLWTQFWTSRGIAVLDVNYGGSTGFGRQYRERLIGEWGVVDVDDSVSGARYLIAQGLADEYRTAISGASAGGYTALAALTFRDVFKAGASHFGVSDLEALLSDIHKFDTHSLDALVGPYPLYRRRYAERSPINYTELISSPVIFFQGLEDTIVPSDQSELMFQELKDRGIPTAYLAFEGEHHGFRQAENIKRAIEAELYFYSRMFAFEPADEIEAIQIENV